MQKALIVIDLQNDYFRGGNMELVNIDDALDKTNDLVRFARKQKYKIYFIQHIANTKDAPFFAPNTIGVELNQKLDIQDDMIIEKHYPNSFRDTKLNKELQKNGINELIVCGAMTHMCIDTTVRAGFDLGYKTTLSHDACATKNLQFKEDTIKAKDIHAGFMSALDSVFCEVKSTKEIMT